MQDVLTFDKMVNAFPVSLVKFDVAYPYGDKHEEFSIISEEAAELPNMFIGEVGIKDYGDKVILPHNAHRFILIYKQSLLFL